MDQITKQNIIVAQVLVLRKLEQLVNETGMPVSVAVDTMIHTLQQDISKS